MYCFKVLVLGNKLCLVSSRLVSSRLVLSCHAITKCITIGKSVICIIIILFRFINYVILIMVNGGSNK